MGNGEIARDENFLLVLLVLQTRKNQDLFGKGLYQSEILSSGNGLELKTNLVLLFGSPEHIVLRMSYCDQSLSCV